MSNYNIRKADIGDIGLIEEIESHCDQDIYSPNLIRSAIEDKYTINFLIFENKICLGYISATTIFEECNLLKIVVKKEYRQRGVGKYLLNYLINYCEKLDVQKIYLEVRKDNFAAINLYQQCGFVLECVRSKYYNGIDALIYCYYNDQKSKV